MASWKKIIVSGSSAELANLSIDSLSSGVVTGAAGNLTTTAINGTGNIVATDAASLTNLVATGSFTGSFAGDGSGLTGIPSTLSIVDQSANTDTVDLLSDQLTFSGSNGFNFTVSDNKITLNSPQNLGTADNPTFATASLQGISLNNLQINGNHALGDQLLSGGPLVIEAAALVITPETISSSLVPIADAKHDLGSLTRKWNDVHARAFRPATISGSTATLAIIGDAVDIDAASELSIDAVNAITITSTNSTVRVEGTTFNGNDVTIPGNLTVSGTQTNLNVANLDVEDRYILLNSGSATADSDSGIVFGGTNGTQSSGSGLIWDASYNSNDGRLSVVTDMGSTDAANVTPSYHVAGVIEGTADQATGSLADHAGNIRIDGGEIFIYV